MKTFFMVDCQLHDVTSTVIDLNTISHNVVSIIMWDNDVYDVTLFECLLSFS